MDEKNSGGFRPAVAAMLILWWGTVFFASNAAFACLAAILWGLAFFLVLVFPGAPGPRTQCGRILVIGVICRAALFIHILLRSGPAPGPALIPWVDMATLLFLTGILHHRGLPLRWALLYACNPLIIAAGEKGLPLITVLFLMTGALYFYQRRAWRPMYLLLGIALGFFPLAAIPAGFFVLRSNAGSLGWVFPTSAAALMVLAAAGIPPLFPSALLHAGGPVLHGPLFSLAPDFAFDHALLRYAVTGGLMLTALFYFHPARAGRFDNDPVPGLFFAAGLFLFMARQITPAAFILLVLFFALRPNAAWALFFLALSFMFRLSPDTASSSLAVWWAPFYAASALAGVWQWKRFGSHMRPTPCRSVSVVIPALNEEDYIGGCIESIRGSGMPVEIIVADGGSSDLTPVIAAREGARVVTHCRPYDAGGGRGGQINAGVRAATGDTVAVVHADTRVPPGLFDRMTAVLNQNPDVSGGAAGCRFDARSASLALVQWLNDARAAFIGIGFGDQVQFFRRRPVASKNLFPAIPLMEDVELSLRLLGLGRQVYLFDRVTVSARRWQKKGAKNGVVVIGLVAAYLITRLWRTPDTAAIYRSYYRD